MYLSTHHICFYIYLFGFETECHAMIRLYFIEFYAIGMRKKVGYLKKRLQYIYDEAEKLAYYGINERQVHYGEWSWTKLYLLTWVNP
ncbi:hypothetical protein HanPI659440_Chr17g0701221 [Helianthus annuus]|nr:hypothetical protein HanPI659440_Chr17g0701221 [Helianthus annuus]